MDKTFDKNAMLQLSIFDLRNLARDLGVYSPTLYKKQELIEKMFAIINGDSAPHIRKSKKGRPPKNRPSERVFEAFISADSPEDKFFKIDEENKYFSLNERAIAFLESSCKDAGENKKISGFVDILDEGYGFLRFAGNLFNSKDTIYISQRQIAANKLKKGDRILAEVKILADGNPGVLLNVISINDNPKAALIDFDEIEISYPAEEIDFKELSAEIKLDVKYGSRNLIVANKENKQDLEKVLISLTTALNTKIVFVCLEALPEKNLFLNSLSHCEYFYTTLEQPAKYHVALIEFAIARAKRIAEQGEDVILFADSLDKIIKNQNIASGAVLTEFNPTLCKKLFACARNFKKGSITVIALSNLKQGNNFEEWVIDEFENIADNIY